ncbi:uncharacterized protein LOC129305400 [Prosopis cineraria]|uniref:uncharacterized protein LOC129305400 n=1 Tax=Prosopis cineraria TaxID=364024 RepID=UPI00240F1BBB|nr:uncharacterized protein LOC129305400 [Prosopis cineraria]
MRGKTINIKLADVELLLGLPNEGGPSLNDALKHWNEKRVNKRVDMERKSCHGFIYVLGIGEDTSSTKMLPITSFYDQVGYQLLKLQVKRGALEKEEDGDEKEGESKEDGDENEGESEQEEEEQNEEEHKFGDSEEEVDSEEEDEGEHNSEHSKKKVDNEEEEEGEHKSRQNEEEDDTKDENNSKQVHTMRRRKV